jgi:hypothetical protein
VISKLQQKRTSAIEEQRAGILTSILDLLVFLLYVCYVLAGNQFNWTEGKVSFLSFPEEG